MGEPVAGGTPPSSFSEVIRDSLVLINKDYAFNQEESEYASAKRLKTSNSTGNENEEVGDENEDVEMAASKQVLKQSSNITLKDNLNSSLNCNTLPNIINTLPSLQTNTANAVINFSPSSQSNTDSTFAQKCANNRYASQDRGPFSLYVEALNRNRLHAMAIGKLLRNNFSNFYSRIVLIKSIGFNRVKIVINSSFDEANELLKSGIWSSNNLICFIPGFFLFKKGVVRNVDSTLSEGEIVEFAESDCEIIEARRIFKFKELSDKSRIRVPTPVIIISFRGQVLPCDVKILGVRCRVEQYQQRIVQCYSCLRYGHSNRVCKNKIRCELCAGEHPSRSCQGNAISCVFCGQGHKSTDSANCPEYARQQNIKLLMLSQSISFLEANALCPKTYIRKSINKFQSQAHMAPIEPNLANFPPLPTSQLQPQQACENINYAVSHNPFKNNFASVASSQLPSQQFHENVNFTLSQESRRSSHSPGIIESRSKQRPPAENVYRNQENISNSLNIPSGPISDSPVYRSNILNNGNFKDLILEVIIKIISGIVPTLSQEISSPAIKTMICELLNDTLPSCMFTPDSLGSSTTR